MSIANPTLDELLSSPIGSTSLWSAANTSRTSFTQEIQQMMYGFGDYERPLYESAQLIEHIVHQQMTALLWQALSVAHTRQSKAIGVEEILFLMRFDRQKLNRLVKHLSVKDVKNVIQMGSSVGQDIIDSTAADELGSADELTAKPPQQTKRVKLCYDFLSSIDSTGALLVVFDDRFVDTVKHERDVRTDRISVAASECDYYRFVEARQTGFSNKARPTKFKDWLLKDSQLDLKPNPLALEVLQYLAKETVSQIVDLALLVKQDYERDVCDPLASLLPQKVINKEFPHNAITTTQIFVANDSDDPLSSHSSQSSPFLMSSQSKSMTTGMDGSKSKKRKRGDQSKLSFEAHSYCISPAHIREAIRRYFIQSGPFAKTNQSFNQHMNHNKKLLCL